MEQIETLQKWLTGIGTTYAICIVIGTAAFAFIAVCGGVAILRMSKRFEHPRGESQQEGRSLKSGHTEPVDKHADGKREALARFQGRGQAERPPTGVADQKYWPPSAK